MAESKTIKQIKSQLRNPEDVETLRMLLKRHKKRLQSARLTVKDGYLHWAGTAGQAISYWMRGVNYLRTKGTLDRKAFKKRKCFENSRKSAKRFARGNELASSLYAMVMKSRKTYVLFCFLKKKSILLIKDGKTVEEAKEMMIDYLRSFGIIKRERSVKSADIKQLHSSTHDGRSMKIKGRNQDNKHAGSIFNTSLCFWSGYAITSKTGRVAYGLFQNDS